MFIILVRTLLGTSGRFDWIPGTKLCMAHAHLGKPVWFVSTFQSVPCSTWEREINECNLNGTICVLWKKRTLDISCMNNDDP